MARPFPASISCIICKHPVELHEDNQIHLKKAKAGNLALICPACQAKIFYEAKQALK